MTCAQSFGCCSTQQSCDKNSGACQGVHPYERGNSSSYPPISPQMRPRAFSTLSQQPPSLTLASALEPLLTPRNAASCCPPKACGPQRMAVATAAQHPLKSAMCCLTLGVFLPVLGDLYGSSLLYQFFFPKGAKFADLQKSKHVLCTNWAFICLLLCLAYKIEKYNYQFTASI